MNTLILENNPKESSRLGHWLESFTQNYHLDDKVSFKMELAVTEAVSNIIDYAYDSKRCVFSVASEIVDNAIIIELKDNGRPFNPLASPDVELTDNLGEAKIGGLGIHLIRNYTDEWFYQRENSTNKLKITISL